MDSRYREDVKRGQLVDITLKADQGTDKLTRGRVKAILTSIAFHPRGIKVMLEDGQVGRIVYFIVEN